MNARAVFKRAPQTHTWYSVRIEDVEGRKAWSNPIWVRVVTYEPAPGEETE